MASNALRVVVLEEMYVSSVLRSLGIYVRKCQRYINRLKLQTAVSGKTLTILFVQNFTKIC